MSRHFETGTPYLTPQEQAKKDDWGRVFADDVRRGHARRKFIKRTTPLWDVELLKRLAAERESEREAANEQVSC